MHLIFNRHINKTTMQQVKINILSTLYTHGKNCFGCTIDVLATNVATPMWQPQPFQRKDSDRIRLTV